jgi:hypothetical protein
MWGWQMNLRVSFSSLIIKKTLVVSSWIYMTRTTAVLPWRRVGKIIDKGYFITQPSGKPAKWLSEYAGSQKAAWLFNATHNCGTADTPFMQASGASVATK